MNLMEQLKKKKNKCENFVWEIIEKWSDIPKKIEKFMAKHVCHEFSKHFLNSKVFFETF